MDETQRRVDDIRKERSELENHIIDEYVAGKITRREFYEDGVIRRTEEDTDFDGRIDKWETYDNGEQLIRVDLDLEGKGFATRRLIYRPDGTFDHVEEDVDGDGRFVNVSPPKKGGDGR